jgi:hypothetical protein
MEYIHSGQLSKFTQLLRKLKKIEVYQLLYTLDQMGYNLVHQCVFFKQDEMLKVMVKHFKLCCQDILVENNSHSAQPMELSQDVLQ